MKSLGATDVLHFTYIKHYIIYYTTIILVLQTLFKGTFHWIEG